MSRLRESTLADRDARSRRAKQLISEGMRAMGTKSVSDLAEALGLNYFSLLRWRRGACTPRRAQLIALEEGVNGTASAKPQRKVMRAKARDGNGREPASLLPFPSQATDPDPVRVQVDIGEFAYQVLRLVPAEQRMVVLAELTVRLAREG